MGRNLKKESRTAEWSEEQDALLRELRSSLARAVNSLRSDTTVTDLAKATGYTRSTWSTLLNQEGRAIQREWSPNLLVRLPEVLGCPLWEVFFVAAHPQIDTLGAEQVDIRIAALEKELEMLRRRKRREEISKEMAELSDKWSALKAEKEHLEKGGQVQ